MSNKNKISGIYAIKNKTNNKLYIGQSQDIKNRWSNHKNRLNNNKHSNKKLQNSWNKYGEENFEFVILEECSQDIINDREIYWISYYNTTNCENGYNLSIGGEATNKGAKWTEEQKNNASKNKKPRQIVQLDLNGNFIDIWRSASQIARFFHTSVRSITKCVNHEGIYHTCGFIWIYKDEYEKGFNVEEYKIKHSKNFDIPIVQYDLYGNLINEWASDNEIDNTLKLSISTVRDCCRHKRKTYNGYIWMYKYDNFILTDEYLRKCRIDTGLYKIKQYDLDGNLMKVWTKEEIMNSEYDMAAIGRCCRNISKTSYNYIWEYE